MLPDGAGGREISLPFELQRASDEDSGAAGASSRQKASLTLVVARDTSELMSALAQLSWLLVAACGSALLACLALLAKAIQRGLISVQRVAATIGAVGRHNLSDRLEVAGVPLELRPVIDRLNEMLTRLELAFDRERGFTADVAHELRTPLSGLETALEVCAARPRQQQEYERVISRCLNVTRNMHSMVDSLLVLARADAGTLTVRIRNVHLDALIEESWESFAQRAEQRKLHVTLPTQTDCEVMADPDKLRQAVQNLFDNAVAYADEGGYVAVTLTSENDSAVSVIVCNSGSRLTREEASRATDRFWRGDAARSQVGHHCGLGLAITRELLAVMGGTLSVTSMDGEFRVEMILPAVPYKAAAPVEV